jgi:hypothetical protein
MRYVPGAIARRLIETTVCVSRTPGPRLADPKRNIRSTIDSDVTYFLPLRERWPT